jgi:hypothetical protein
MRQRDYAIVRSCEVAALPALTVGVGKSHRDDVQSAVVVGGPKTCETQSP